MQTLPDASVDAVVTDPPAGIGFMKREWDSDKGGRDAWVAWLRDVLRECHRVMKPGAHAFLWALPRTSHWTAWALEEAGFEIREKHYHLFGSGFPKSLNVAKAIDRHLGAEPTVTGERNGHLDVGSPTIPTTPEARQWAGWGTATKPAAEEWILARKPLIGTVAANVLAHGTGTLNINACRIGWASDEDKTAAATTAQRVSHDVWNEQSPGTFMRSGDLAQSVAGYVERMAAGRWPANVILDEAAAVELDRQSGESASGDAGGASRFFYVAKPDGTERDAGLEDLPVATGGEATNRTDGSVALNSPRTDAGRGGGRRNTHPTVKPIDLMRYLVRLVTPRGGLVLDPFVGSGTSGIAAVLEGARFLGIDLEQQHIEIATRRIRWWAERSVAQSTSARDALSTTTITDSRQQSLFGKEDP